MKSKCQFGLAELGAFFGLLSVTVCNAEFPPEQVVTRLTTAIRENCPDADIQLTNGLFKAKHGTMIFTLHRRAKTGEISKETSQQEGPNFKGFMLTVSLERGLYSGQAMIPQEHKGPYYSTFLDGPRTEDGTNHYWITFSYGGRLDPQVKQAIFEALPGTVVGQPAASGDLSQFETNAGWTAPIISEPCAGRLGHAVGTYLRIEGVRAAGRLKGAQWTLVVDTVNGKRLEKPVGMRIENLNDMLPNDERCIFRGYETGRMVGAPPAVFEAAKEEGKDALVPQAAWHFNVSFVVLTVVEPEGLKIRR